MSRRKGSVGEREVAGFMQEWWEPLEAGCVFKRTPLSGGWGDATSRGAFKMSGDLMTTAKLFPFCVEIKRREAWSYDRLSDGKASPVWKWWRQTQTAALECNLEPMLWFRKNRTNWLVMIGRGWMDRIKGDAGLLLTWPSLRGIDYGAVHPVVYAGAFIVSRSPTLFLPLQGLGPRGVTQGGGAHVPVSTVSTDRPVRSPRSHRSSRR